MDNETRVHAFFDAYARRFNEALLGKPVDVRGVTDAFADYFVEASPAGVRGGRNGLLFRLRVPLGFRHYRKIGTTAMRIAKVTVTPLDDLHLMARVRWDSRYRRKDGVIERIEFENLYFLQMCNGEPRIFAYVTGDEAALLREHGIG
ncbi:MAG TPA: hypothetical protein VLF18_08135 [Tahibacter sp.]|uniref:hypothetical protein n=1 Tax=Tahibacter sp. TaxID=2056211 RepID=UPI002B562FC5|nr:hypothetical protein [Tahibacter sp.]HSX60151.1 hypothetical protein [Tahibacter sp.]